MERLFERWELVEVIVGSEGGLKSTRVEWEWDGASVAISDDWIELNLILKNTIQ